MPGTEPPRSATAANDEADRLIARGNAEEDAGRLAEAIACYRQAIAAAPLHARAHLNLGIGLEAGGDGDAAVGAFDRAIALEPSNARAASDLAALLGARGEWDDADRWVRAALEREPDDPEAHFALSDILDAKGKPEAAAASSTPPGGCGARGALGTAAQ